MKAKSSCSHDGCEKYAQGRRAPDGKSYCTEHGKIRGTVIRTCRSEGCGKWPKKGGLCVRHGGQAARCSVGGCDSLSKKLGLCKQHGGVTRCNYPDCRSQTVTGGVCYLHGAQRAKCNAEGCDHNAVAEGLCTTHNATRRLCTVKFCPNSRVRDGLCKKHGARQLGCFVDGCDNVAQQHGVCIRHGAVRNQCKREGCHKHQLSSGFCGDHGGEVKKMDDEEKRWYIGGMFDGDGCCCISGDVISVIVTQADKSRAVLRFIRDYFGFGTIRLASKKRKRHNQNVLEWRTNGTNAVRFAQMITDYCVEKKPELEALAGWRHALKGNRKEDNADALRDFVASKAKYKKASPVHEDAVPHCPPLPWMAGFLDAEGHFCLTSQCTYKVSITQKKTEILYAIQELWGGRVYLRPEPQAAVWAICGEAAADLMRAVNIILIGKRKQVDLLLFHKSDPDIMERLRNLTGVDTRLEENDAKRRKCVNRQKLN